MTNSNSFMKVVDYIPASLHENKDWNIVFYARDPQCGDLRRKRIRVRKIKDLKCKKRLN